MAAPLRHSGHELARVALRVPLHGVRIGPLPLGFDVPVVEDSLDHAGVHQQAFDAHPFVFASGIGRLAVDEEAGAIDGDLGFHRGGSADGEPGQRQSRQSEKIPARHYSILYRWGPAPFSMTERLYYTDCYLREFRARVIARSADGRTVQLDRTAFYPSSGGQ